MKQRYDEFLNENTVEHYQEDPVYLIYRIERSEGIVYPVSIFSNRKKAEIVADLRGARMRTEYVSGPVRAKTLYVVCFLPEEEELSQIDQQEFEPVSRKKSDVDYTEPFLEIHTKFIEAKESLVARTKSMEKKPTQNMEVYALKIDGGNTDATRIIPI